MFVHDELKWNVESKMSKEESKSFLLKTGKKWLSLSEEQRDKLNMRYKKQREELKQSVKSYLQVNSNLNMGEKELHKRINEMVRNKFRQIQFNFKSKKESEEENEKLVAFVHDDLMLIHSDITKVEIKQYKAEFSSVSAALSQAGLEDNEDSIKMVKRKLNLDTMSDKKKAKSK
jgi:hypothetical protein